MRRLQPSQVWHALGEKRQWQVLEGLLRRFHRKPLPAGAINIGIGYRTFTSAEKRKEFRHFAGKLRTSRRPKVLVASRKHERVLTSDLCLRFYVEKKVRRPRHPLPKVVRTTVMLRGKRRWCEVPVDIAVAHGGRPQCYLVARGELGQVKAAGCCIVARTDDPAQQFLLGCHHVLTLSMINDSAPNQPGQLPIEVTLDGTATVLASTHDWSELIPVDGVGFDAALALGSASIVWPDCLLDHQPTRIMSSAFPPRQVTIHSPRGDLVAEFVDYLPSKELAYGNQTLRIGPIFQFAAQTFHGDSGSAVMDGSSLCGMHFYGNPDTQTALALTADAIFRKGQFSFRIKLP